VTTAFKHCHAKGIVHRNLKPSNLLLSPCGASAPASPTGRTAWLAGFGLAQQLGKHDRDVLEVAQAQALSGSTLWEAPEVAAWADDEFCDRPELSRGGWLAGWLLPQLPCEVARHALWPGWPVRYQPAEWLAGLGHSRLLHLLRVSRVKGAHPPRALRAEAAEAEREEWAVLRPPARQEEERVRGVDFAKSIRLDRLLRPARTKQFCYESARDIWALGCIAAAMARGLAGGEVLHPFGDADLGTDPEALLLRVARGELRPAALQPQPGCAYGKQLRSFVEACTRYDPLQRWTAEQLLGHPLLRLAV
jgi:serine/threonine protein kinase